MWLLNRLDLNFNTPQNPIVLYIGRFVSSRKKILYIKKAKKVEFSLRYVGFKILGYLEEKITQQTSIGRWEQ